MLRGRSSFIFHLCDFGPFNSSPAFSSPQIWLVHLIPVLHFQSPPIDEILNTAGECCTRDESEWSPLNARLQRESAENLLEEGISYKK